MTGVSDLASIDAQMDLARELVPNAKNIGLIYCSSEVNSEIQANMVKDYCKANGLNVVEKTVNNVNDIQQTAESLAGQVNGSCPFEFKGDVCPLGCNQGVYNPVYIPAGQIMGFQLIHTYIQSCLGRLDQGIDNPAWNNTAQAHPYKVEYADPDTCCQGGDPQA